jgi:hypothetical protein
MTERKRDSDGQVKVMGRREVFDIGVLKIENV